MMLMKVEEISYHVEINGNGEPVILLHGFTGDHTTWGKMADTLKGSFRVLTIDLLGHGKSDSPSQLEHYQVEAAVSDLIHLMDELEIDKAHFLGYSMGGRLALSLAMMHPERVKTLMLESASPGLKTPKEREARIKSDEALAQKIVEKGMENFVDYWEEIPLFHTQRKLPSNARKKIRTQRLKNNPMGLANSLRGFGTGRQPSWWKELHLLDMPVLLMCGELDEKFCRIASEMAELIHSPQIIQFIGAGHAIHVEEPNKFGTIVKEFLKNSNN